MQPLASAHRTRSSSRVWWSSVCRALTTTLAPRYSARTVSPSKTSLAFANDRPSAAHDSPSRRSSSARRGCPRGSQNVVSTSRGRSPEDPEKPNGGAGTCATYTIRAPSSGSAALTLRALGRL